MKYLNFLITFIIFSSCAKDEGLHTIDADNPPQLKELVFSGCKGNKASSNNEILIIEQVSENKIMVTHQNVMFNCCIDEVKINLEVKENDITLEESSANPVCNCICPYDIQFYIDNLEMGKFNFTITYHNIQKAKISFKIPLEKTLEIEL